MNAWPDSHIELEGDAWYFWDETESERYGPYATHDEALTALLNYAKSIE